MARSRGILAQAQVLQKRAQATGYVPGSHREEDSQPSKLVPVSSTTRNQDNTLNRYLEWRAFLALEKGITVDEKSLRDTYLGQGAEAPDVATVKDFLRFYVSTRSGQLSEHPTTESTVTLAEWFFAGFLRVTGTDRPAEDRTEVFAGSPQWIRRTLTREGLVKNITKIKHNFDKNTLVDILLALWTNDDPVFISNRYRIQFTFLLLVYCWTGARIGAFFVDGLRYKDIELWLRRDATGKPQLFYTIAQRWVKNNRDPEHVVFDTAMTGHSRLLYDDVTFLLALALADNAIQGVTSEEDLMRNKLSEKDDKVRLYWTKEAEDLPICRKVTKAGGICELPMSQADFEKILKVSAKKAGYVTPITVHSIRRFLGKKVDAKYTPAQRAQHLIHQDTKIYGQYYVAHTSDVNGQSAFLDEAPRHEHIEWFQSFERFHWHGCPFRLPAAELQKIEDHKDLSELKNRATVANGDERKSLQSQLRALRTRLQAKALEKYRTNWVEERNRVLMNPEAKHPCDRSDADYYAILCLIEPERARLAALMKSARDLDQTEFLKVSQDLVRLCLRDPTVTYRPGEYPSKDRCPECEKPMASLKKPLRSTHIHKCRRDAVAREWNVGIRDVQYCYHCFQWIHPDSWDQHCQLHLDHITSRRCGLLLRCHTLLRPAYCPFCLGDKSLSPSWRYRPWPQEAELRVHLEYHLQKSRWPLRCPHPMCEVELPDLRLFSYHLSDIHDLRLDVKSWNGRDEQDVSPTSSQGSPSCSSTPKQHMRQNHNPGTSYQWIPCDTTPQSSALKRAATSPSTWGDVSEYSPSKKCRNGNLTICPMVLSNINDDSAESSHLTDLEYRQTATHGVGLNRVTDERHPIFNTHDTSPTLVTDDEDLFSQFLVTIPSSPVSVDTQSFNFDSVQANDPCAQLSKLRGSPQLHQNDRAKHDASEAPTASSKPRIRLWVKPQITLHLRGRSTAKKGRRTKCT